MKNWIILLMPLLIIYWEVRFDIWQWSRGKDDKPVSTWIRVFWFVVFAFITGFMLEGNYWLITLFAGIYFYVTHLLLFNYWLNLSRKGIKLSYRKDGEWWTDHTPWYGELFAKLWFYWVGWILLFHLDWVAGDYPDKLIEFFMF